jgi:hypothetical protein
MSHQCPEEEEEEEEKKIQTGNFYYLPILLTART